MWLRQTVLIRDTSTSLSLCAGTTYPKTEIDWQSICGWTGRRATGRRPPRSTVTLTPSGAVGDHLDLHRTLSEVSPAGESGQ